MSYLTEDLPFRAATIPTSMNWRMTSQWRPTRSPASAALSITATRERLQRRPCYIAVFSAAFAIPNHSQVPQQQSGELHVLKWLRTVIEMRGILQRERFRDFEFRLARGVILNTGLQNRKIQGLTRGRGVWGFWLPPSTKYISQEIHSSAQFISRKAGNYFHNPKFKVSQTFNPVPEFLSYRWSKPDITIFYSLP